MKPNATSTVDIGSLVNTKIQESVLGSVLALSNFKGKVTIDSNMFRENVIKY